MNVLAVYALNVFFIAVWSLVCFTGKQTKCKRVAFLSLCFVQLFLISSLRYNVGNDYVMYSEAFLKIGIHNSFIPSYLDWEYGFVLYTKVITLLTNDVRIYFAVTAFVCLLPVFIFIYKNSRLPWLSVLLYVNLSFFYLSLNFLRQSIAIAISLMAWEYLKCRRLIPFILLIIFGAFFHTSILVLLPVYFLCGIKPSAKLAVFYGYLLLVFFISSNGAINLFAQAHEFKYENSIFIKEGLSLIYSVIPILFLILAAFYQKKLLEFDSNNKYLMNMLYLSAFLMLIMSSHAIIERLSYYTYIYVIILLPELILSVKSSYDSIELDKLSADNSRYTLFCGSTKGMLVGIAITLVILAVTTIYNFGGMHAGENGIHGVYPYQSIVSNIVRY